MVAAWAAEFNDIGETLARSCKEGSGLDDSVAVVLVLVNDAVAAFGLSILLDELSMPLAAVNESTTYLKQSGTARLASFDKTVRVTLISAAILNFQLLGKKKGIMKRSVSIVLGGLSISYVDGNLSSLGSCVDDESGFAVFAGFAGFAVIVVLAEFV